MHVCFLIQCLFSRSESKVTILAQCFSNIINCFCTRPHPTIRYPSPQLSKESREIKWGQLSQIDCNFHYCSRVNLIQRPAGQPDFVVTPTPELQLILSRISPIREVKLFGQLPLSWAQAVVSQPAAQIPPYPFTFPFHDPTCHCFMTFIIRAGQLLVKLSGAVSLKLLHK